MENLKILITSSLLLLLLSCSSSMPRWIEEKKHAVSPDGKAVIYETILDGNQISVGTWVNSSSGSGGAGVFNIQSRDSSGVKLSWISDSTVLIEYPADSRIIRKEDSSFFAGRTINVKYKTKKLSPT